MRLGAGAVGLCLVAAVAATGMSGASAAPRGWIGKTSDPASVMRAVESHHEKLPTEFFARLRYTLPDGTLGVMVTLARRTPAVERFARAETAYLHWYGDAPRFFGHVTQVQLAALLRSPNVIFVDPDYPITNFLATATLDIHARSSDNDGTAMWSFLPDLGIRGTLASDVPGRSGDEVSGKGVTVAMTDSGIDATHRDFGGWDCDAGTYAPCDSRIIRQVTADTVTGGDDDQFGIPTTDLASGHGTHTAGIVAGNGYYGRTGAADPVAYGGDGHVIGVAPQASLVSVKLGDSQSAALGSEALQWELDHVEKYDIRVSSNSWGCGLGCAYDSNSVYGQIFKDFYNSGVVVTFAAGNNGDDSTGAGFNGYSQSPYVLSVAAYDHTQDPPRIADFSSRGVRGEPLPDPTTWTPESEPDNGYRRPDISAPGVNIWSADNLTGGTAALLPRDNASDAGGPNLGTPPYTTMSGTSMATPMVAGAAADLMSACPGASNLDVMRALMIGADTARILETTGSDLAQSFDTGYGGLDVRASFNWLAGLPQCGGSFGTDYPPVPVIEAPSDLVTGSPGSFDGSKSTDKDGSVSSYSWDFGDGTTADGVVVQHTFTKPGFYTVKLTATDDSGAARSRTATVAVARPPVWTQSAHIQEGATILGTASDFIFECPHIPATQGVDGYVFTVPDAVTKKSDRMAVTARGTTTADLGGFQILLSVWTKNCQEPIVEKTSGGPNISIPLPPDVKYLEVAPEFAGPVDVAVSVGKQIPTQPATAGRHKNR